MRKLLTISILSCCFILLLAITAHAAEDMGIPDLFENIATELKNGDLRDKLANASNGLFWSLAFLYFTWNTADQLMHHHANPSEAVIFGVFRTIVYITLFHVFLCYAWSLIIDPLGNFFSGILGTEATIQSMTTSILKAAIKPYYIFCDYFTNGHFQFEGELLSIKGWLKCLKSMLEIILIPLTLVGLSLLATIAMVIIAVAGIKIIMIAVVAKIDLYLTQVFAILALGFWGSPYTKDIAMNALRAVVASAIQLTVTYALAGVTLKIFDAIRFYATLNTTGLVDCYYLMLQCIMAALIMSSLFQTIPARIAGIFGSVTGHYAAPVGTSTAGSAAKSAAKAVLIP